MHTNSSTDDDALPDRPNFGRRTAAPRSASGGEEAALATDVTHVIHSWIANLGDADSVPLP